MEKATKEATRKRHEAIGRQFADKIRSRVTAVPKRRGPARASAPFRRTFDSAKQAAEEFYGQNIDFVRPLVETGEPREAVREWLRSNHGKTGRMRVKDSSETPWARKIIQASNPIRAALTNVFGHAKNRRWDQVDWDSIRALGEAMVDAATDTSGPMGWYWYPVATEDDDAKILDRLSVEGDMDAYRRFAKTLSAKEVERVADTYAAEVKRLAKCMPAERRRRVNARIEEIRSWAEKGIPENVCGQQVYSGHTCDLEPIHGEMQRLREACSSDAAFTGWLNSAVSRLPRAGSVAELEDGNEDMPGFVPASAFEGDPDSRLSAPEDACTPTNAAKVMGKLAAKKRRENAAKRRKVRETNAALRKAERERISAERRAQRGSRRGSKKAPRKGSSKPKKTDGPSMLSGLRWRWKANPGAWLLLNAHGYQVASMSQSKRRGDWLAYYHPPGKDGVRVNIDDDANDDQAKAVVEVRVRDAHAVSWWADLSKDGKPTKDSKGPLPLTHEERIAIGGNARDKALFEKHGKGRVGRLVVDYIDGSITDAENRELEALGLAKNDMLTDDGWVLYKSIKGDGDPKPAPAPAPAKASTPSGVPVRDVFTADVMRKVKPKHVAKVIKVLVEKEKLLPPGHTLSARTPREGIVYLTARAKRVDHAAVTRLMQRLFPDYQERLGAQQELHLVPNHYERDVLKTIAPRYADTLRVLALREAGVKTNQSTVIDQAAPKVNDTAVRPGSPVKCAGEWCVEVVGQISIGDPLVVTTRRGKTWNAVVTEIVKTRTKGGVSRTVVRSSKLPSELLRGRPVDMLSADGRPEARPVIPKGAQGSLVTPEQEGFALTHPKGTAAVHGKSAGTGGTQSTLPGVSRKVSAQKMTEMKARSRKAVRGSGSSSSSINSRSIDTMTEDDVSNAFYGKYDGFFSPLWLLNNILQKVPRDIAGKGFEFRLGKRVDDASGQGAYAELYRNNKRLTHGGKNATLSVERGRAYYVVGIEGMPKAFATKIAKVASEVMNDPKLGMQDNGNMIWRHV